MDEDDPILLESEDLSEEKLWKEGVERIASLLLSSEEGSASTKELDLIKAELGEIPRPKAESIKAIRTEKSKPPANAPKGPKASGKKVVEVEGAPKGPKGKKVEVEGAPTGRKNSAGKRKAEDGEDASGKRLKGKDGEVVETQEEQGGEKEMEGEDEVENQEAEMTEGNKGTITEETTNPKPAGDSGRTSALFSVLDPEELNPTPKVMERADQEKFLLEARKRALRRECEFYCYVVIVSFFQETSTVF